MPESSQVWDAIIVGGGPAGVSAATVLARSRRRVLIIDDGHQRNLRSHGLHNFITRDGILPKDFLKIAYEELTHYPVDIINQRIVDAIKEPNDNFLLKDKNGKQYSCKRLLLATGVSDKIPDIPGMKELWGSSVFHCPFCDGYECMVSQIGMYAKNISGYGMALFLKRLCKKVILFTDGADYLKPIQKARLEKNKIEIVSEKISHLVSKDNKLEAVALESGKNLPINSMFTHEGYKVKGHLLEKLGCRCTRKGVAITNRYQESNVKGVYVAGDASFDMHFVIVAAAEGVKAGVAIHNSLLSEEYKEDLKRR